MTTKETLEEIREAWQPMYPGRKLTLDDAQNISNRLTVFFQLLAEVDMTKTV